MKEILTTCIKAYQDAIEFIEKEGCEDFEVIFSYLKEKDLHRGICWLVKSYKFENSDLFIETYFGEYFLKFMHMSPLFFIQEKEPYHNSKDLIETCLQPRLNFLQSKLAELENKSNG